MKEINNEYARLGETNFLAFTKPKILRVRIDQH